MYKINSFIFAFFAVMLMLKFCAPFSPTPSPLPSARLHRRSPAGSEPAPQRKCTRMARIGQIFTDFPIRGYPCHPRNPRSIAASLFVDAPEIRNAINLRFAQPTNLRSSAVWFLRKPHTAKILTGLTGWTG